MELARAIIYAAATGIVIHVAGATLLHHEDGSEVSLRVISESVFVFSAVVFIVMDGIARYCVRREDELAPDKAPLATWLRFVIEVFGLFSFSYWAAIALEKSDPFHPSGKIFIAAFALSCIIHNLLSYLLILKRKDVVAGGPGRMVLAYLPIALSSYARVMIWGDALEDDIGNLLSITKTDYERVKALDAAAQDPDGWRQLIAALRRLGAQAKLLNVAVAHLIISILSIWSICFPRIFEGAFAAQFSWVSAAWLTSIVFVSYAFYVITSQYQLRRYENNPPSAIGWVEWITQLIANLLLLGGVAFALWSLPIFHLYLLYAGFMILTIYAVLRHNLGSSEVVAPIPADALEVV